MKKLTIFLLCIVLISSVSALTISPNPINIQQQINQEKVYSLTINNTLNFPIFNFQFSDSSTYGFSFPDILIPEKSLVIINFTINPTQAFSGTLNSVVSFRYNASVPTEVSTYNMNITSNGFSNNFMTIRQGDTITWKNLDTIVHSVSSTLFSNTILPTESFSYTFNQIGTFDYQDPSWQEFSGFKSKVQVISRTSTEQIHNPNYDIIQVFNLDLSAKPTILEITPTENSFQVTAIGSTEGLIKIKNVGNETATGIKITSDSNWITPKEDNFQLNPQEQKFVAYEISPLILETNQTNQTYDLNITIKASNSNSYSKIISVFIPYDNSFDNPNSAVSIFALLEKFCKQNPSACSNSTNTQGGGSQPQGNFTINETQSGYEQTKRDVGQLQTDTAQNTKTLNGINQKLITLEQINQTASEAWLEQQKNKDSNSTTINTIFILLFGVITSICVIFLVRRYQKFQKIESMRTGRIKPRGFGLP